ncbi:MAG TPA: CHC2 zinc finger domain-containing protein [Candidatus Sulfotelmatobacter sp.]|jgi:hypothetical protein|nr:CHC2 zinc finger domain-containing protein [Candidatus Sulfotelmatobacter sp.]
MEDIFDLPIKYTPQKFTDEELQSIFPEAKEIISQKIFEYKEERDELISQMRTFYDKVKEIEHHENKDESFSYFWTSYLKYFHASTVIKIDKHLYRLYRQKRLLNKNNDRYPDAQAKWEEQKERAENYSLCDLALPYLDKIRQTANRITALCPFHKEKTPSFTIFINQNSFHCFGCQAHGNVITFKMRIDTLSFKEAVKELSL